MDDQGADSFAESREALIGQLRVERRRLGYLDRMLRPDPERSSVWFNAVVVTPAMLADFSARASKELTVQLYHLALSISRCMAMSTATVQVLQLIKIFDELDFHTNSAAVKFIKSAQARATDTHVPDASSFSSGLTKCDGAVYFQALATPHMPFDLDHAFVASRLVRALEGTYARLIDDVSAAELDPDSDFGAQFELIVELDMRFKQKVLTPIVAGLGAAAVAALHQQIASLRGGLGSPR